MIDFNFENSESPKAGSLLISDPFMEDDNFVRSVILLCGHNEEGSFGFVLNHPTDIDLSNSIENFPSLHDIISVGGPVEQNNLFFLHRMKDEIPNSIEIEKSICIGGKFERVKEILNQSPDKITEFRFFLGYSGWSVGQLQDEINQKSWLVINHFDLDLLFSNRTEDLWKDLLSQQGRKFSIMSNFPNDPNLN